MAEARIGKTSLSRPSRRTIRTYNGIITVMIGKMQKDWVAIRIIIARLGGSFATKRNPSFIPVVRFSSSSTVPLRRGGKERMAMISATNETALAKNAEERPQAETK